jgi:hypothetical protein
MRKIGLMVIGMIMGLFLVAGNAMAVGIDIFATVNPNFDNSWDEDFLSGKALYTVGVESGSPYGANVFAVSFENDIFASIGTADFLVLSPGWTLTLDDLGSTEVQYEIAYNGSDILEQGETLSFWVEYTLFSLEQYTEVFGPGWAWSEGGVWEQAVSATNTNVSIGLYGHPSGGTSTAPVPEPTSLLLLGSGLLGLVAFGGIRRKRS